MLLTFSYVSFLIIYMSEDIRTVKKNVSYIYLSTFNIDPSNVLMSYTLLSGLFSLTLMIIFI